MPHGKNKPGMSFLNVPGSRTAIDLRSKNPGSVNLNVPESRPVSTTSGTKPGRRVGRNPTPGIPRRVGSINVTKKNDDEDRKDKATKLARRRRAVARRMAAKRNKG